MNVRRAIVLLAVMTALPGLAQAGRPNSIVQTRHNLSVSGRGAIRSLTETRICIFCHSSHNASREGPLWNHETTVPGKFQTYNRVSLAGRAEQPNGATKLCLSCHDGTIAVGAVRGFRRTIPMRNVGAGGEIPEGRRSHVGTDLSGTHPVSIRFQQNLAMVKKHLRWPPLDPENVVGVDANGYVQCTACHNPHGSRSEKYPLWQKESFDQVCQVCHAY